MELPTWPHTSVGLQGFSGLLQVLLGGVQGVRVWGLRAFGFWYYGSMLL